MKFYIVCCKNRKKFDKFVKLNRVRNKVIIDIKQQLEEEKIDYDKYKDYFNVVIYTKITHALRKGKDIYYIPNFANPKIDLNNLSKYKEVFHDFNLKYLSLIFIKDFVDNSELMENILSQVGFFDASQIIEDY